MQVVITHGHDYIILGLSFVCSLCPWHRFQPLLIVDYTFTQSPCILSSTLCGTHCIISQLAHFTHYLTCWVMLACFFLLQDSVEFQKLCVSHLSRLSHKRMIFWKFLKFTLDFVAFKNVTVAWFPEVKEVGTFLPVLQLIKFPYLFLHLLDTMLRLLSLVLG